ncbi:lytic transglycosylase domain-containing protein [Sphingobium fuliginis]|jgi:hypothetical protein|uniref:lytic transglycosylase domain-containing protein n=1 Tax=Sphingobium fuliginis (strain ATCC 27551) TaxID=336203 RepID=UPI000699D778|nr:lytic transglycosylase domain-containing protein [Sphingobium fuliginis]
MNHASSAFSARRRLKPVLRIGCLAVVFAASTAASPSAGMARPSEGDISNCIARAAGGKDWLEKTLWGLRDQEGGWIGAEVANANGSHDLGLLQINSWWVPKIAAVLRRPEPEVRTWLKSDACFNADVARWIFLSALRSTGDYWAAIGVYHSPTAWRQRRYALSVADHLTRRFGPAIFSEGPVKLGGPSGATTPQSPASPTNQVKRERVLGFGVVARSVSSEAQD